MILRGTPLPLTSSRPPTSRSRNGASAIPEFPGGTIGDRLALNQGDLGPNEHCCEPSWCANGTAQRPRLMASIPRASRWTGAWGGAPHPCIFVTSVYESDPHRGGGGLEGPVRHHHGEDAALGIPRWCWRWTRQRLGALGHSNMFADLPPEAGISDRPTSLHEGLQDLNCCRCRG